MSEAAAGRFEAGQTDVLVVEDDPDHLRLLARILDRQGYRYRVARSGEEALVLVTERIPDVAVLDLGLPGISGTEVLAVLRADWRTAQVPVLFVSGHADEKVAHLLAGADDYVTKPYDPDELAARIALAIRRVRQLRDTSPLTRLAGNTPLHHETARRLEVGTPFASLWVDIDNFKAFNDRYGYLRGDAMILALAESVQDVLGSPGLTGAFPAHVGGDDFVVLVPPERAEEVAGGVCERFERAAAELYDAADLAAGHITVEDRQGRRVDHPLISLSVAIVFGTGAVTDPAELAARAAEVKALAKRQPGSGWVVDRRDDTATGSSSISAGRPLARPATPRRPAAPARPSVAPVVTTGRAAG